MGISSGSPNARENEAHKDLAYWIFVNKYDSGVRVISIKLINDIAELTNARASRFESNEALTWPYNQYDQPSQRPNPNSDTSSAATISHMK